MDEPKPRRRRREALSCAYCRQRKIRCDRKQPCNNCVAANRGQCDFLGKSLRSHVTPSQPSPPSSPVTRNDASQQTRPSAVWPTDTVRQIMQRRSGLPKSAVRLNKTKLWRSSHSMAFAVQLTPIRSFFKQCVEHNTALASSTKRLSKVDALASQTALLLQECKQYGRIRKAGRLSRSINPVESPIMLPSPEIALRMATVYSQTFESTQRILHLPTFWQTFEAFWKDPDKAPRSVRLLVLLVVLIGSGCSIYGEPGYEVQQQADSIVYAAQAWLSGPTEKDRLTIVGLQIFCLVLLARQIFSLGGDLTWISTGSLVHRAMQMALHRDPAHLPPMSVLEAEVRRRLWATIIEYALQSSLDSALPPRLNLDEFDTQPPANADDSDLTHQSTSIEHRPRTDYTDTTVQLLMHDTVKVRLRALHLLYDLSADLSYPDVLSLSSEILEASRAIRQILTEPGSTVSPFTLNLTMYMLQRFVIPLHCAFFIAAHEQPLFEHSVQICMDAAMTITSPTPDETFRRLLTVGGGMFREGLRLALWVFGIPLLTQAEAGAKKTPPESPSIRLRFLRQMVEDLRGLATRRIEQGGETNVKAHMFLSMVLAQVDALQSGKALDIAIAQAAKASVQFSHDLLSARHSVSATLSNNAIDNWLPYLDLSAEDGQNSFNDTFMHTFLDY